MVCVVLGFCFCWRCLSRLWRSSYGTSKFRSTCWPQPSRALILITVMIWTPANSNGRRCLLIWNGSLLLQVSKQRVSFLLSLCILLAEAVDRWTLGDYDSNSLVCLLLQGFSPGH